MGSADAAIAAAVGSCGIGLSSGFGDFPFGVLVTFGLKLYWVG
jgi:hypothetical protein